MPAARSTITIPAWANGPDGSGNGGWSAGLLAGHLGAAALRTGVTVSLRQPPPIGRPLELVRDGDGRVELCDAGVLVAEAETAAGAIDPVAPDDRHPLARLSPECARAARAGYPFRHRHPFPRCVCCGTERDAGEPFLDLHCGPVEGLHMPAGQGGGSVFADAWRPSAELADEHAPEVASVAATWSALDCPSATPIADPDAPNPSVLARLTVAIEERPRIGRDYVVAAWLIDVDGRKSYTASVIVDPEAARPIAQADALWIEVRPR